MSKHFFFGKPDLNGYNLIKDIIDDNISNYLLFDDDNKLIKINKLTSYTNEISTITVGNVYEFKDNMPLPFYNFGKEFCESHFESLICSITLTNNQYNDLKLIANIIKQINNKNANLEIINKILNNNLKNKCSNIFNDFINNYNDDNYKYKCISNIYKCTYEEYNILINYMLY